MSTADYTFEMSWGDTEKPFRAFLVDLDLTGATSIKLRVAKTLHKGTAPALILNIDIELDGAPGPAGSGVRYDWEPEDAQIVDPGDWKWQVIATFADDPEEVYRPKVPALWRVNDVLGDTP